MPSQGHEMSVASKSRARSLNRPTRRIRYLWPCGPLRIVADGLVSIQNSKPSADAGRQAADVFSVFLINPAEDGNCPAPTRIDNFPFRVRQSLLVPHIAIIRGTGALRFVAFLFTL